MKTTILKKLQFDLDKKKYHTVYLSADDLSKQDIFSTAKTLINFLEIKYNFPSQTNFLFIDEFQYIQKAGLFIKNLYDQYTNKLKIIVAGSSSLEITQNTEFLTGRHIPFYINRISFLEYINYKESNIFSIHDLYKHFKDIKNIYNIYKYDLQKYFKNYIRFGGYPAVITHKTEKNKIIELKTLITTYIEKML